MSETGGLPLNLHALSAGKSAATPGEFDQTATGGVLGETRKGPKVADILPVLQFRQLHSYRFRLTRPKGDPMLPAGNSLLQNANVSANCRCDLSSGR